MVLFAEMNFKNPHSIPRPLVQMRFWIICNISDHACLIFLIIFHLLSLTLQLVLWKTKSVPFSNGVDYIVTEWQGECFYFFVLFLGGINLGTYGDRCSYSLHDNLRFFCQRIFQGSSLAYLWSLLPLLAKRTITDDSPYVRTPALKAVLALDDAGVSQGPF